MAIESKNLLVWVKAMSRGQALPLDASEIYSTLAEAENYASTSAIAYPGQTVKALTDDGKYHSYTLQPSESGYVLEEVGAIKESDLKQYVMVVESLPESGQVEGILYISGTTGSVWTGSAWRTVFHDVQSDLDAIGDRIDDVEEALDTKAPIANPVFTGTVKVGEDEVALKSYVEGLIANLTSSAPGIVDSNNSLPETYKAGQTFRVAEAGTYAGVECEVGDLIMVVSDYNAETASDADFMVLQANIDGAVTSTAEASTVGEIVVFDAVTGKVIKGSGIQIASLSDAIAKAHEHANKATLDTYDKTQTELLAAAKTEAEALVTAHETAVDTALAGKADKATTLAGYGIEDAYNKTAVDSKLNVITENLNTKASTSDVETALAGKSAVNVDDVFQSNLNIYNVTKEEYAAMKTAGTLDPEALYFVEDEEIDLSGYATVDHNHNDVYYTKTEVDTKVATAKEETLSEAAEAASEALEARVGAIPADTTIKSYIDTAVGSGGTASAEAIATAKQEAIETSEAYTDEKIAAALAIVEF